MSRRDETQGGQVTHDLLSRQTTPKARASAPAATRTLVAVVCCLRIGTWALFHNLISTCLQLRRGTSPAPASFSPWAPRSARVEATVPDSQEVDPSDVCSPYNTCRKTATSVQTLPHERYRGLKSTKGLAPVYLERALSATDQPYCFKNRARVACWKYALLRAKGMPATKAVRDWYLSAKTRREEDVH